MGKVLLCSSSVGLFPAPPKQLNAKAADVLQEMLGMLFIYLFCLTAASTGAKKKNRALLPRLPRSCSSSSAGAKPDSLEEEKLLCWVTIQHPTSGSAASPCPRFYLRGKEHPCSHTRELVWGWQQGSQTKQKFQFLPRFLGRQQSTARGSCPPHTPPGAGHLWAPLDFSQHLQPCSPTVSN